MWIKKTTVASEKGNYTYHQLVRSYHEDGRSRQEVLLNLGTLDEEKLEGMKALAKTLDNKPYQFIPQGYASLLPMKRYGETFLLGKAFELTSSRRFIEDYLDFLHMDRKSADYVFLLLAYYSFQKGEESLSQFLESYFVHGIEEVDERKLVEAMSLICRIPCLYPGLEGIYRSMKAEGKTYVEYLVKTKVAPEFSRRSKTIGVSVSASLSGFPLRFSWGSASTKKLDSDPSIIYATMDEDNRLPYQGVRYLTYISHERLCAFLGLESLEDLRNSCRFEEYETYLNGTCTYGGVKIIFRRMQTQDKDSWTEDLFLTNVLDLEDKELFVIVENTSYTDNFFYRVFIPKEIEDMRGTLSEKKLIDAIVSVSFTRLFMEYQLVQRLESFGVSLEDVYNTFRDCKILQVGKEKHKILIHTAFSEEQSKILELISFNHSFQNIRRSPV